MQIPGSDKQLFITLLDFSVVLTSFQISTSKRNIIRMPSPRPCHKAEMKISDHRGVIWEGVETSCPLSEVRNRGAWETANLPSETRCEKKKKSRVCHQCVCTSRAPGNYSGGNPRRKDLLETQNHAADVMKIKTGVTFSIDPKQVKQVTSGNSDNGILYINANVISLSLRLLVPNGGRMQ